MGGIVIILLCSGIFFYDGRRICHLFGIKRSGWIIGSIALILGLFIYFSIGGGKQTENISIDIIKTLGSWLVVGSFLLIGGLLVEQIISHFVKIPTSIISAVLGIILGIGIFCALKTTITPLTIISDKIHQEKKILIVSDIHVDFIFSTFHLKKIKNTIKEENPDLVLLLGDLFNKANPGYEKFYQIFKDETVPMYAVIGNHDIMGDDNLIYQIPQLSPIKILTNETVELDEINLVGIMDKSNRRGKTLDDILQKISWDENQKFTIFLTHQPITLNKLEDYPIDLELAGHTHRGQFFGMRKIVEIVNGYGYGEYHYKDKTAFVSQGIGTWGFPFRLGTQSEIVILNLLPKKS